MLQQEQIKVCLNPGGSACVTKFKATQYYTQYIYVLKRLEYAHVHVHVQGDTLTQNCMQSHSYNQ